MQPMRLKTMPKTIGLTAYLMLGCPGAFADTMDTLQGAWTMSGTNCAATFRKAADGQIEFVDRGSSLTTGILIAGNKIVGPHATCTAERIRDEKDHLSVHMNCADAIMFSDISVSFRIVDADNFERFDPSFRRCP